MYTKHTLYSSKQARYTAERRGLVLVTYLFNVQVTRNRLAGLVVKASASTAEDPGFDSRLRRDFFPGRVIPVT